MWQTMLSRMILVVVLVISGLQMRNNMSSTNNLERGLNKTDKRSCPHPLLNTDKCAPRVFIVGAMKCGTNDMMKILALHRTATFQLCSQQPCSAWTHQAERNSETGEYSVWEAMHLPSAENLDAIAKRLPDTDGFERVSFDKSPKYMETHRFPEVPAQLRTVMPQTKIVFAVCDPAERLFAEFNHNVKVKAEHMSPSHRMPDQFAEFVRLLTEVPDKCDDYMNGCQDSSVYFGKGDYAANIKKWMEVYPLSDLLVLDMNDPRKAEKLLQFANLSTEDYPWSKAYEQPAYRNEGYAGREAGWTDYPKEMQLLSSYYSKSNHNLANLLNATFPLEWRSSR